MMGSHGSNWALEMKAEAFSRAPGGEVLGCQSLISATRFYSFNTSGLGLKVRFVSSSS